MKNQKPNQQLVEAIKLKESRKIFEDTSRLNLQQQDMFSKKNKQTSLELLVNLSKKIKTNQQVCSQSLKLHYSKFEQYKQMVTEKIYHFLGKHPNVPTLDEAFESQTEIVQQYNKALNSVIYHLQTDQEKLENHLFLYIQNAKKTQQLADNLHVKTQKNITIIDTEQPNSWDELELHIKQKKQLTKDSFNYGLTLCQTQNQKRHVQQILQIDQLLENTLFNLKKIQDDSKQYQNFLQTAMKAYLHVGASAVGVSHLQNQFHQLNEFAHRIELGVTESVLKLQQESLQPNIQVQNPILSQITQENLTYLQNIND